MSASLQSRSSSTRSRSRFLLSRFRLTASTLLLLPPAAPPLPHPSPAVNGGAWGGPGGGRATEQGLDPLDRYDDGDVNVMDDDGSMAAHELGGRGGAATRPCRAGAARADHGAAGDWGGAAPQGVGAVRRRGHGERGRRDGAREAGGGARKKMSPCESQQNQQNRNEGVSCVTSGNGNSTRRSEKRGFGALLRYSVKKRVSTPLLHVFPGAGVAGERLPASWRRPRRLPSSGEPLLLCIIQYFINCDIIERVTNTRQDHAVSHEYITNNPNNTMGHHMSAIKQYKNTS